MLLGLGDLTTRPIIAVVTTRTIIALITTRTVPAVEALAPVTAVASIRAFASIMAITTFLEGGLLGRFSHLLVTIDLVVDIIVAHAALVLILETCPVLAQDAKIMIRELQIIFRLNAVAGKLCVAGQALVFLKQLGGIATLAIVLPVSRLTTEILPPLSSTAAPAAALSIVDQILKSLRLVANPFASDRQGGAQKSAL
jgi:hypothetical protein